MKRDSGHPGLQFVCLATTHKGVEDIPRVGNVTLGIDIGSALMLWTEVWWVQPDEVTDEQAHD